MIKSIILLSALLLNSSELTTNSTNIGNESLEEIHLVFSKAPIGVESGQPVYPVGIEVFVEANIEKEFIITVNGLHEIKERGQKIDISKMIDKYAGTHTVSVEARSAESVTEKIFGFTTK